MLVNEFVILIDCLIIDKERPSDDRILAAKMLENLFLHLALSLTD